MALYAKHTTDILIDPKILAIGPSGYTLWSKGLIYSVAQLTDGVVHESALAIIGIGIEEPEEVAAQLVAVGLWKKVDGGWSVGPEKWARHQTTRDEVEDKRQKTRERVAKFRGRNASVTPLQNRSVDACNASGNAAIEHRTHSDAKASGDQSPFARAERVMVQVHRALGWSEPKAIDVRQHLKRETSLQTLIDEGGEKEAVALFLHAHSTWEQKPTWKSVCTQRNQLREQLKGTSAAPETSKPTARDKELVNR